MGTSHHLLPLPRRKRGPIRRALAMRHGRERDDSAVVMVPAFAGTTSSLRHATSAPLRVWTLRARGHCATGHEARFREHIGVSIAFLDFDPVLFDCFAQSALKVIVSYLNEAVAPKHAARRNLVSRKDAQDLASNLFVR